MEPLRITARLDGAVALHHAIHFDALLMAAVALRDNLPPALTADELQPIEIPVQRSECWRYYLASVGVCEAEAHELKYVNRRFPLEQVQWMGDRKIKTINLTAGPQKMFRIPLEIAHMRNDTVQFFCVGERTAIERLLLLVTHLGKRRAVGLGRVVRWVVEPCEPWPGFPVLSADGEPMRNLPEDTPGVTLADVRWDRLEPPYWLTHGRVRCVAPVTGG